MKSAARSAKRRVAVAVAERGLLEPDQPRLRSGRSAEPPANPLVVIQEQEAKRAPVPTTVSPWSCYLA